jgi:hypothetical protein
MVLLYPNVLCFIIIVSKNTALKMNTQPLNIVPLLEAISLIIGYAPIEQKEFVKKLRHVLVHKLRKEFPDDTIAELSQKIGMLRGKISETLDEDDLPKTPPSNEAHILTLMWKMRDENDMVDLTGENGFYSIAKKQLVGRHSADTSLKILLNSSSVEIVEGRLYLHAKELTIGNDTKEVIRVISNTFLNFVETVLHNSNEKNNTKFYQNTITTRGIHPGSIKDAHAEVYSYLKSTTLVELRKIIETYENQKEYNYPMYSIALFEHYKKT